MAISEQCLKQGHRDTLEKLGENEYLRCGRCHRTRLLESWALEVRARGVDNRKIVPKLEVTI